MLKHRQLRWLPLLALVAGCSTGGDGFRAEEVPTKAEVQKKIEAVKANANIPEGAKPGILAGLDKEMGRAK